MNANEFQQECLRTVPKYMTRGEELLMGLMGLNGEAGECIDLHKKTLFQGHQMDYEHLAKELGDVAWYLAVAAHAIDYDLEKIMQMNVDKLRNRYPNGWEAERSLNRDAGDK